MSVQDYIAIFKDLNHRSNMSEHHSKTIISFVWGLVSKIRCAMITGPYDLDTIEEAFDVALKLELTFQTLVNVKAGVLSVRDIDTMIINVSRSANMLEQCLVMMLTTQRLLRIFTFLLRLLV